MLSAIGFEYALLSGVGEGGSRLASLLPRLWPCVEYMLDGDEESMLLVRL